MHLIDQQHFHLRPAKLSDAYEIASIHMASRNSAFTQISKSIKLLDSKKLTSSWRKKLSDKNYLINIAHTNENKLVGFIAVILKRPSPEISHLYVDPRFWRKKIGWMLIKCVLFDTRLIKYKKIFLWSLENSFSEKFYLDVGFKFTGQKKLLIEERTLKIFLKNYETEIPRRVAKSG